MKRIPRRPRLRVVPMLGAASAAVTRSPISTTSPLPTAVLGLALLAAVVTVAIVVCAAVWSKKKTRRDAALAVLDRVFRRQINDPAKSRSQSRRHSNQKDDHSSKITTKKTPSQRPDIPSSDR